MRRDDAIAPLSLLKKLTILNSDWEIRTEHEDVKEYFDTVGFEFLEKHLYLYFLEMLTMFDYGNSFTEPVFKLKQTTMGDKVCLTDLKTRAPHSMEYHTDKKGDITFYRQLASSGDIDMYPGKYIHLVHNQEFQNPYGQSDFTEGVYTAWWSKQIVIKFMNIYLERYGAPTVVAKYKSGAPTRTEKTDMLKFVKNLSAKSGGVFSDKFELDLLESKSGQNPFIEAINLYNLMISRAMLNPDLTGFGGSEVSGGSYALGEQQFDAWYMSLELPKKQLIRQFNRKIVKPLIAWNFGAEAAAESEFVMQTVSEAKKAEQAKIYIEAVKNGVTPAVIGGVNTMLKAINYPEVTDEDMEKAQEAQEAPAPIMDISERPRMSGEPMGDDVEEEEPQPEDMACGKKKKQASNFALNRQPNKWEQKYDFTRANNELDALEETWFTNCSVEIESSINAMVTHIQKRKIIENKRLDLVEEVKVPHQAKIRKQFRGMLKSSYSVGDKNASDSIPSTFAIEQQNALDDVAGWIGAQADMLTSAESAEILKKVKPVLIDGIRSGKGVSQIMTEIDKALKGWDITLNAPRVETIVRTNVASAWNQAKVDRYQKVESEIQAYEYSAIMDTRTSDLCKELDGKIIRKSEVDKYNPPNHFNCRSTLIPIFTDEDKVEPSKLPATKDAGGSFLELA